MSGVVQAVIAVAFGLSILMVGRWAVRVLVSGGPPEVDPAQVVAVESRFRCIVCGMQLTVTQAQGDEVVAPRHCHEEMEPIE